MTGPDGPIAVPTPLEADYSPSARIKDIPYAVCIALNKIDHVLAFSVARRRMSNILNSLEAARTVAGRLADGASAC